MSELEDYLQNTVSAAEKELAVVMKKLNEGRAMVQKLHERALQLQGVLIKSKESLERTLGESDGS